MTDKFRIPVKSQPLIFLISTGDSMSAEGKLEQINRAVNTVVAEVKKRNGETLDAQTFVRIIRYSSSVEAIDPSDSAEICMTADGSSDFAMALDRLGELLEEKEFADPPYGIGYPVIIYITDSYPSTSHWRESVVALQDKVLYKGAIKLAVAIGRDADTFSLSQVVDSNEKAVLKVTDITKVGDVIQALAMTAVRIAPSPALFGEGNRLSFIIRRAMQGELADAVTEK